MNNAFLNHKYFSAGMMLVITLSIVFSSAFAGNVSPPQSSLFFTPKETREAEMLAQKYAPAGQGDIHLGAVISYGPDDWTIWLQNEKWTPETSRDDLQVLDVTADEVRLLWRGEEGAAAQEITLRPHQSYRLATKRITAGP